MIKLYKCGDPRGDFLRDGPDIVLIVKESDSVVDEVREAAFNVRSLPDESLLIQELGFLGDDGIIGLNVSLLYLI